MELEIHRSRADGHRLQAPRSTREEGLERVDELVYLHWLREIAEESGLPAPLLVALRGGRGQGNHRDGGRLREASERDERLEATDPREVDVHDHEVGAARARERDSHLGRRGG